MELDLTILKPQERAALELRVLYEKAGYGQYRMGRFEEYGLYQENQSFLASKQVITFTDLDGRLLALKPDVTLSIAKNAQPAPGECKRYYYTENVYRPSLESHTFREISQTGVECIGNVDGESTIQVVELAADSLAIAGGDFVLALSHMGFVTGLMDAVGAPEESRERLLSCIRDKNAHELQKTAADCGLSPQGTEALCSLTVLCGDWQSVIDGAAPLALNSAMGDALTELSAVCRAVSRDRSDVRLIIDLSIVNEIAYYNGLVLRGYLEGLPRAVLKGGRYDGLARRFSKDARAVGFALYLDELQGRGTTPPTESGKLLNVALPKGRLGDRAYELLSKAGYGCGNLGDSRKLVVENPGAGIRYFLVKPSDVAIYVEHGAADVGIVGKDILAEESPDVYELMDTGLGECRMCVASRRGFEDDQSRTLRVATKFVNIAKNYYASIGRDIDIIKLNGSIELAPLLGLSDVIVDIVETGVTLRENDLAVVNGIMPISARLIANKASCQFKRKEIDALTEKLAEVTENDKNS